MFCFFYIICKSVQGNVALDVARVLLRPTEELGKTDIASHAISALADSSIRFIYHSPVGFDLLCNLCLNSQIQL